MRVITLNDLVLTSGNYSVMEVSFDNAPALALNTLEIARQDGSKLISANYAAKEITISGMIKGTSQDDLDERLDTFKKAISGTRLYLDIVVNQKARRWIVATAAIQIGDPRLTYQITFIPYTLTLMACDPPFGEDTTYSSVYSGNDSTAGVFSVEPTFGGTAKPKPWIRYSIDPAGSLETIVCKSERTNRQLEVSTAWANGDVLDIDCYNLEVKRNSQPIQFQGVFPEFELDTNELRTFLLSASSKAVSQEESDTQIGTHPYEPTLQKIAQQFEAPATTTYTHLELALSAERAGGEPGNYRVTIQTDSGSNTPSGTIVADSTVNSSTFIDNAVGIWPRRRYLLPSFPEFLWVTFGFARPINLTSGTKYWIVVELTNPSWTSGIYWKAHTQNKYTSGLSKRQSSGSWVALSGDFVFRIYRTVATDWRVDLNIQYKRRYL